MTNLLPHAEAPGDASPEAGRPTLPAAPATVADFVGAVGTSRKPATVKRYLASIAAWHAAADLANTCPSQTVKMAVRAHARTKTVRQRHGSGAGAGRRLRSATSNNQDPALAMAA